MIHYHGTPITPDKAAVAALTGRHGLVSFAHTHQMALVAEICQSFVLDNGAFSAWRSKTEHDRWGFYCFVEDWMKHPGFDWALIPDVIDGTEEDNDALLDEWMFGVSRGVPVWHFHESIKRLKRLVTDYPRVALGSSGEFSRPGAKVWWERMRVVMNAITDDQGRPVCKLHGLRMLDPRIFSKVPFSSADSCNVARNVGIDKHWQKGSYPPPNKGSRGIVIADRIESHQSANSWEDSCE